MMMKTLFMLTGVFVWALLATGFLVFLFRILWDGYRAFTVLRWAREVSRQKAGEFPVMKQVKFLFKQWRELLFVPSGHYTISGPGGYWNDHDDWEATVKKKEIE